MNFSLSCLLWGPLFSDGTVSNRLNGDSIYINTMRCPTSGQSSFEPINGLTINAQLSWGKHVEEICKKLSSVIGALKLVRPFISKETAIQIYNALIMPHFDYCSPVRDCLSGYLSESYRIVQPELLLNYLLLRAQTTFSPPSTGRGYLFGERSKKP